MSLLSSAQGLAASCVALARTRLELVGTELQEELTYLAVTLLGGLVAVLLAALGIAFASVALLVAVGEEHRVAVAGSLGVVFIFFSGVTGWSLRRLARARPPLFAASKKELERDYRALTQ